jgi:hypothetical protein
MVARQFFHMTSCMFSDTFDKVDWTNVYWTLTSKVHGLFQVWACNQVMNLAATNKNLRRITKMGEEKSANVAQFILGQPIMAYCAQRRAELMHSCRQHPSWDSGWKTLT